MPVIIHTRTGVCRGFRNFDLAFLWIRESTRNEKYLFTSPEDFRRISANGRRVLLPRLAEWSRFRWSEDRVPEIHVLEEKTLEDQNKLLWYTVNQIADPVTIQPPWLNKSEKNYEIDLDVCKKLWNESMWEMLDVRDLEKEPKIRKPPDQLKSIVRELMINDQAFMTETQVEDLMNAYSAARALQTVQSAWRIFRYYRPILEQVGILR